MSHMEAEILFCQTCSQRQGKLKQVSILEAIGHIFKGHHVKKGKVQVKTRPKGGIKFHVNTS